jgi:hypothetical protein
MHGRMLASNYKSIPSKYGRFLGLDPDSQDTPGKETLIQHHD